MTKRSPAQVAHSKRIWAHNGAIGAATWMQKSMRTLHELETATRNAKGIMRSIEMLAGQLEQELRTNRLSVKET